MNRLAYARLWQGIGWLLLGVVALLSLMPGSSLPSITLWDKAEHFLAYMVLMLWFWQAFPPRLVWFFFLIGFGVMLELLQGLLPTRSMELNDMVANTLGAICGLWLALTPLGKSMAWVDRGLASLTRPRSLTNAGPDKSVAPLAARSSNPKKHPP